MEIDQRARLSVLQLAVLAGVLLLALLGIELTAHAQRIASIWFANGLLVAVLLQHPRRRWTTFVVCGFAGNVAANLLTGDDFLGGAMLALCNSGEVLMSVLLLRQRVRGVLNLALLPHLRSFVLRGVLLPSLTSAALASVVLHLSLGLPPLEVFKGWLPADALGLMIVVPLLSGHRFRGVPPTNWLQAAPGLIAQLLGLAVLVCGVFVQTRYPLLCLVLVPLLILAYRHGRLGASAGMFMLALSSIALTIAGYGPLRPNADRALGEQILFMQGFLLFAFAITFAVAVLMENQRRLDASLRRSRQRLITITEQVPAIIARVDPDLVYRYANRQYQRVFGLEPGQVVGRTVREVFGEAVHAAVQPHVRKVLAGHSVTFERHATEDGRDLYLQITFTPDRDRAGKVVGFYAFVWDISARKRAELLQALSERRLQTIADNMPALITYIDERRVIRFCNATYRQWMGVRREDILDVMFDVAMPVEWVSPQLDGIRDALAGHRGETSFEVCCDGRRRSFRSTFVPHRADDGGVVGVYVLTADITALTDIQQQLTALAKADALTGLPNRREFEERLEQALARSRRSAQAVALLFLDVDHFKSINDSHGHGVGDAVLREFAARLAPAMRQTDFVARLAGDEFVILVEGPHAVTEAQIIAQKVLAATDQPVILPGLSLPISVSIGIAISRDHDETPQTLLAAADSALYEAKRSGRGTSRLAKPRTQDAWCRLSESN